MLDSKIPEGTVCVYEGCEEKAIEMACGRSELIMTQSFWLDGPLPGRKPGHRVGYYCGVHAVKVSKEDGSKYMEYCPNCGCWFGVSW